MDFFRQIQLINEAYAIEHNLPVKRQFTAAELEQPIEQVREAAEQAKSLPLLLVEQTLAIRESAERLREPLEVTEEHRREAAEDMERAYPERRPR